MAKQVKIWTMDVDYSIPEFYSKVKVVVDETYASLRACLEEKQALEWPFQFWDNEERCRIRQKIEGLNDVLADVYVLPLRCEDEEPSKRRRLEEDGLHSPATTADDCQRPPTETIVGGDSLLDNGSEVRVDDAVGSSRVTGASSDLDSVDHQLNSTLLPIDVWDRYLNQAEKMKRDLKCSSQEDNRWLMWTSDFNGSGVVKIFCLECRKEIGGDSGMHDKISIQNLFNNFKSKHLLSTNHVKNWCAHNDVQYADHPQSVARLLP